MQIQNKHNKSVGFTECSSCCNVLAFSESSSSTSYFKICKGCPNSYTKMTGNSNLQASSKSIDLKSVKECVQEIFTHSAELQEKAF